MWIPHLDFCVNGSSAFTGDHGTSWVHAGTRMSDRKQQWRANSKPGSPTDSYFHHQACGGGSYCWSISYWKIIPAEQTSREEQRWVESLAPGSLLFKDFVPQVTIATRHVQDPLKVWKLALGLLLLSSQQIFIKWLVCTRMAAMCSIDGILGLESRTHFHEFKSGLIFDISVTLCVSFTCVWLSFLICLKKWARERNDKPLQHLCQENTKMK